MKQLKVVLTLILGLALSMSSWAQTIEERLDAIEEALASESGGGGHAGHGHGSGGKTSIGGYGELHYNAGDDGGTQDRVDIHRFVLFFGHEYNDDVKFFSEFEIEHSLACADEDDCPGEVEMEQMYVDVNYGNGLHTQYGVFLIPVGILNETHEPDTFYGVERNRVEARIIPTTWWEAGVKWTKDQGNGLTLDAAIHSGMEIPTTGVVRSGRQKVAQAETNNFAYTARVKKSRPGLEMAFTYHNQTDAYQSRQDSELGATLMSAHVDWTRGPWSVQALIAEWSLDNPTLEAAGRGSTEGHYLTVSYKLNDQWGIFARYETLDEQAGNANATAEFTNTFGFNYWIHPQVVLKADFQSERPDSGNDDDIMHLGFGYSF